MRPNDIARELTPTVFAQVLAQAVNGGPLHPNTITAKQVTESLYDQHRTLQAMVIQLLIEVLLAYDPGDNGCDLRNDQAAISCSQLRDLADCGKFTAYIPLI